MKSNGDAFVDGYRKSCIGLDGFFIELGFCVFHKRMEPAGRFRQLYTNGLPHSMGEYELRVNYYAFGHNPRMQLAETYVPRLAAFTSNNGIIAHTQNGIAQAQLQVKF